MKNRAKNIFLIGLLTFFSYLMLKITLQYLPIDTDVAFLRIKQQYIHITHWRIAFFVHVFTSVWTLIAGFTQFFPFILRKYKALHRFMGKIYVFDVLFVAGPAGLVMSLYANGGIMGRLAFILLSILWLFTTYMAWERVRKKDFIAHKQWMVRSYALTLSAVTLRAWKWLFFVGAETLFSVELPPRTVYIWVAWLGWVLNLAFAEYLISRRFPQIRDADSRR